MYFSAKHFLFSLRKAYLQLTCKYFSLYQTLLLIFAVLVQVSLSLQSVVLAPLPPESEASCPAPDSTLQDLVCFSYSLLLLLTVTAIAIVLRCHLGNRAFVKIS